MSFKGYKLQEPTPVSQQHIVGGRAARSYPTPLPSSQHLLHGLCWTERRVASDPDSNLFSFAVLLHPMGPRTTPWPKPNPTLS